MCKQGIVPISWRQVLLSCALVPLLGGCRTARTVEFAPSPITSPTETSESPLPTPPPTAPPIPPPTRTPWPTSTPTPMPTATPLSLHGQIVLVHETTESAQSGRSPGLMDSVSMGQLTAVPNLWSIYPDGSNLTQLTFDPGGIGLYYPPSPPPYISFASVTKLPLDTDRLWQFPLPDECAQRGEYGQPWCYGFRFSPSGCYLSFQSVGEGCWDNLQIMPSETITQPIFGAGLYLWFTDTLAMVGRGHCEGGWVYILDLETGEMTELGDLGTPYRSPDQTAFAELTHPYQGWLQTLWVYDLERRALIRPEKWENGLEDSPCWTSLGSHLLYTRQWLSYTDTYTVTFGPRQIWALDRGSGTERMLLGDVVHDYFIGQWNGSDWVCTWQGDWIRVRAMPYRAISAPDLGAGGETNWDEVGCTLYGLNCPGETVLGLNWRTGEVIPWDQVPIPTPSPTPIATPTPVPGPDLAATPVYVAPDNSFALYPGPGGIGLWRVPVEGDPVLLIEDGHHFVYIP